MSYNNPPQWTPAPEPSHYYGLLSEASEDEFKAAQDYCARYPVYPPQLLPSYIVDRIKADGCRAWSIRIPENSRFVGTVTPRKGTVQVTTGRQCQDTCLLSDLPIMSGLYGIHGKRGFYYEIEIKRMDGIIAVGTACQPYPSWRLPGWNRLSAGLHLDDFRKFFEDPEGGRDYTPLLNRISPGDTVGCGYDYPTAIIFLTYNGQRLPPAFTGVYLPREQHDIYAAIGVEGNNEFEVNFGADLFRWKEGNEWAWRVEGQVGTISQTGGSGTADYLPACTQ